MFALIGASNVNFRSRQNVTATFHFPNRLFLRRKKMEKEHLLSV